MTNADTVRELFRHMEWADAAIWTAVLARESCRTDARLQEILYHLHVAQRAFLRTWRNEPREAPYPQFDDACPLMQWARAYYGEAMAYLHGASDEAMSQPMPLPWSDMVKQKLGRMPEVTTIGETALQVAMHSAHHRGQANARVREAGGEPPLVDYIAWVWLGRPQAAWPC